MITTHSDNMLQNRSAFQARAAFSVLLSGGQAQFNANALDSIKAVNPIKNAKMSFVDEYEHTAKIKINYSALVMLQERQDFAELIGGKKSGASILQTKSEFKADNAAQSRANLYLMSLSEKLNRKVENKNAAMVQAENFVVAYGIH